MISPPPRSRGTHPRAAAAAAPALRMGLVMLAVALAGAGYLTLDSLSRRTPGLVPRHRAEALCFALAQPPPFAPPMMVQPSAALVRGRFGTMTPAGFALQELMHFTDDMVIKQQIQHVGDFDVAIFWLRLPGPENQHWLVLAWMEDADLAVCNFRFTGTSPVLSAEERAWATRLMRRVLLPGYFRAGTLPRVRLRAADNGTMPTFGPRAG